MNRSYGCCKYGITAALTLLAQSAHLHFLFALLLIHRSEMSDADGIDVVLMYEWLDMGHKTEQFIHTAL